MAVDELWHVAYIYNAHEQLIACVRALRAFLAETTSACEPHSQAATAATKALEELDAL